LRKHAHELLAFHSQLVQLAEHQSRRSPWLPERAYRPDGGAQKVLFQVRKTTGEKGNHMETRVNTPIRIRGYMTADQIAHQKPKQPTFVEVFWTSIVAVGIAVALAYLVTH
jgi:hypothetical protein